MAENTENTDKPTVSERAVTLSEEVLDRVEARQHAALDALRKFIERIDDAMPPIVDDPEARKKVVDAIGDYYDQVASTTNEFVTKMVHTVLGDRADKTDKTDKAD